MSWARVFVLRSIIPTARDVAAPSSSSVRRSWAQMRIAPSGVRSSWEIMAMNSSLARLAASASRRAFCSRRVASSRTRASSRWDAIRETRSRDANGLARYSSGPASSSPSCAAEAETMSSGTRLVRGSARRARARPGASRLRASPSTRKRSGTLSRAEASAADPSAETSAVQRVSTSEAR